MKKMYLSIMLLYPALIMSTEQLSSGIGRIIDAPIIANVDGKFPISLLINFRDEVYNLIEHNHSPNPAVVIKLHDLVANESTFDPAKIQVYLQRCITSLFDMALRKSFFSVFHAAYPLLEQIVEEWAEQFNMRGGKFYPFIKAWKKLGTEREILNNQLHSLQDFEQFLHESHQFLNDWLVSCPKAYAQQNQTR